MNICIGIISYLPNDMYIREKRKERLNILIQQCNYIFNLPILIVAQNWNHDILNLPNCNIYKYKDKLGITGARKELRSIFLKSNFDYIIMLDDDCNLIGNNIAGKYYLNQIIEHPDMYGIFKTNLLKLFAISKTIFNKLDYYNGEAENGEIFEDMLFIKTLQLLYPDKAFKFDTDTALKEQSNSVNDPLSTWYYGQFNKHDIGDKTRSILAKIEKGDY